MSPGSDDPFAPDEARRRREARERAIELLYSAELRGTSVSAIVDAEIIAPDPFAVSLALGVEADVDRLDASLVELLHEGWTLGRLAMLDRWILRLGLHELELGTTPVGAVINEAVELAGDYGATENSGRFVNGVLAAAVHSR